MSWKKCFLRDFSLDKNQVPAVFNHHDSSDFNTDHDYIAPHEKYDSAIGLFSPLLNRQIIDMSFAKLYQQR